MDTTPSQPAMLAAETSAAWMPPEALVRYQWHKTLAGLVFAMIFAAWVYLQWSSPVLRYVAIGLVAVTVWITFASLIQDNRRSRGRQIELVGDVLTIITPESQVSLDLGELAVAEWVDPDLIEPGPREAGLWFVDRAGNILGHVDTNLLAHEAEVRTFLGWLRARSGQPVPARWPQAQYTV